MKINDGNCAKCDTKMFLEVSLDCADGRGKVRDKGHNWSDPGYREVEFRFELGSSGEGFDPNKPIYLHLDCDDWRADLMERSEQHEEDFDRHRKGRHAAAKNLKRTQHHQTQPGNKTNPGCSLYRVVPPGRRWYFFSQGDHVLLADDHQSAAHPRVGVRRNFVETTAALPLKSVADLDGARPRSQNWTDLPNLPWLVGQAPAWTLGAAFVGTRVTRVGIATRRRGYDVDGPWARSHDARLR